MNRRTFTLFLFTFSISCSRSCNNLFVAAANCTLSWSSRLPSYFPLIWNDLSITYPQSNGKGNWGIDFESKSSLQIGCSEVQNVLKNFNRPVATVKCDAKGKLRVGRTEVNFADLGCTSPLQEQVVQTGSCEGDDKYDNVEILFQSPTTNFPLITICHNPNLDETMMTYHIVHGSGLNTFEVSNARPGFKEAQYFKSIAADKAYGQKSQLEVVSNLLGSTQLGKQYIDPKKSFYFARGHLAPDGDFVHIYEQNATYYFINVVPQWQVINNGNWKALEVAVRKLATITDVDLKVWTGGKGILKLNNEAGTPVEIYLARDKTGKLRLPAPEISWKVVFEPKSNAALAVFMINNPHLESVPENLILCPDICSNVTWIKWQTKDIRKGYTYCCEFEAAKEVLTSLPDLRDVQLLT